MPHSHVIFRGCGGRTRGLCSHTDCRVSKNDTRTGHGFQCCRDCGRAFSKAVSRTEALCDPEQPRVSHRGLSTERALSEGKQNTANPGKYLAAEAISLFSKGQVPWGTPAILSAWADVQAEASTSGPASVLLLSAVVLSGLVCVCVGGQRLVSIVWDVCMCDIPVESS